MSRHERPMRPFRAALAVHAASVLAVLVGLAAGCGGGSEQPAPEADRTPALRTVDPEQPTLAPSPSTEAGAEESLAIRQSTQGRVFELTIGVASTSDDEASLSISYDSGDEKAEGIEGAAGDSFELDSGYTLTIDEIDHERDTVEQEGQGTGTVTVTVTAPQ